MASGSLGLAARHTVTFLATERRVEHRWSARSKRTARSPIFVACSGARFPSGTVSKLVFIFVGIGMKSALADVSLQNIAGLFRALFTRDRSLLYRLMLGGVGTPKMQKQLLPDTSMEASERIVQGTAVGRRQHQSSKRGLEVRNCGIQRLSTIRFRYLP